MKHRNSGISLIELIIAVAIIGIVAAIGVPTYVNYYSESIEENLKKHVAALRLFQDNFFLGNDTYVAGTMTNGSGGPLETTLDFKPTGNKPEDYKYEVTPCSGGTIQTCYKIKVTYTNDPTLTLEFEKKN